jgi:crotonobetainyl-CoA:carnitine CoA-transferase CaiB-like acyl-CoA transferase
MAAAERNGTPWSLGSNLPLDGVRVFDLTRVIAGPYCSMMLADLGADVIKIEEPRHGDELRWVGRYKGRAPHDEDYFYASNRSKRSVGLNLKDPQHRAAAYELIARSDILVENFSPGVMDRLGLGWREVSGVNPKLVYCSISGFGQQGPSRNRLALDPIIQAVSGIMSVTGEPNGEPMQVGAPIADVISGLFGAYTVVAALYAARETGRGRYIDISMQDAMLSVLGPRMGEALQAELDPARHGNGNPMRVPANSYRASDGKYVAIIVQNDNHWPAFCRAIDRLDLLGETEYATMPGRVKHRAVLDQLVSDVFAQRDSSAWAQILAANRVPFAVVNSYIDALADEQVKHRGLVREVVHPVSGKIRVVGPPWVMPDTHLEPGAPPRLGEHTGEVLKDWLGWDEQRIARFKNGHERSAVRADASN